MQEKTKEKSVKIAKIVLKTIATAGFVSMAILAPNAIQALNIFKGSKKYKPRYYLNSAICRLKSQGLIEFLNRNGKNFIRLTGKGRKRLEKYQFQDAVIEKPKRWDGKWRIVIFDIKEEKKAVRDLLRRELINLGFVKLQNSVWVYPYDCEEVIIMLKTYFRRGRDILYITAEKIENDSWLKKIFNLD